MPRSKFAKFTCDICQKTLRRKQTFEAHVQTHQPPEEKPFKCEICDKSFGSQAWLTRHGKIHSVDGEEQLVKNVVNDKDAPHFSGAGHHNQKHFLVRGYRIFETDPFTIFPREIWCMILENVTYFTDLQNIFKVYPELEVLYRKKRQLYLFGRVMPLIAEWVTERDLLRCRRVSKQWCMGVDNFLENHPSVRAYNQEVDHPESGGSWAPSAYSMCYHGQHFITAAPEHFLYRRYFYRHYSFRRQNVDLFIRKTTGHPAEVNIFVGRSIELDLENGTFPCKEWDLILQDFLNNVFILLNKWGRHIWFLTIIRSRYQTDTQFVVSLQKCLDYLPNLKHLYVYGRWDEIKSESVYKHLPMLPNLETLRFSRLSFADPLVTQLLVPQYARQIRRVQLHLTSADMSVPVTYVSMSLPNLRELLITNIRIRGTGNWKNVLSNILISLDAPQLHTSGLQGSSGTPRHLETSYLNDSEMFGWLDRFHCLKHFYLPHQKGVDLYISSPLVFKGTRCNRGNSFCSSLESICIHIDTLSRSPDILNCFPSLQCLQLCVNLPHFWEFNSVPRNEEQVIRACKDAYKLESFWEVAQNLKKLNVLVLMDMGREYSSGRRYRFSKAAVEKYLPYLAVK